MLEVRNEVKRNDVGRNGGVTLRFLELRIKSVFRVFGGCSKIGHTDM